MNSTGDPKSVQRLQPPKSLRSGCADVKIDKRALRFNCLALPFHPSGIREKRFASRGEADIADRLPFAWGGQLTRSLLSSRSLLFSTPKARGKKHCLSSVSHPRDEIVLVVVLDSVLKPVRRNKIGKEHP